MMKKRTAMLVPTLALLLAACGGVPAETTASVEELEWESIYAYNYQDGSCGRFALEYCH